MKFRPLHDNLLIKPIESDTKTKTGLIIPDTAKEKPHMGEVIAVGRGRMKKGVLIPVEVEVGQKIIYAKYGETNVKLDGEEYLVIGESNVYAVLG